jgi:hypothetical protein
VQKKQWMKIASLKSRLCWQKHFLSYQMKAMVIFNFMKIMFAVIHCFNHPSIYAYMPRYCSYFLLILSRGNLIEMFSHSHVTNWAINYSENCFELFHVNSFDNCSMCCVRVTRIGCTWKQLKRVEYFAAHSFYLSLHPVIFPLAIIIFLCFVECTNWIFSNTKLRNVYEMR